MSGFSDITSQELIQEGAFALLEKPFDRKKLLETLQRAVEFRESRES
jgi:FixJ family two-component response regulator